MNSFSGYRSTFSWINFGKLYFLGIYLAYLCFQWYCIISSYLCCICRNKPLLLLILFPLFFWFFSRSCQQFVYFMFSKTNFSHYVYVLFCILICVLFNVCSYLNYFPSDTFFRIIFLLFLKFLKLEIIMLEKLEILWIFRSFSNLSI